MKLVIVDFFYVNNFLVSAFYLELLFENNIS